jgi:hypothetical protein
MAMSLTARAGHSGDDHDDGHVLGARSAALELEIEHADSERLSARPAGRVRAASASASPACWRCTAVGIRT